MFGCCGVYVFGVWVFFRCSRVHDNSEDQKGDQRGGPKMAKNSGGVKPDIFKRAAQKWLKLWVG